MVSILLSNPAVRVHDSKAYRKMAVTRERISRILELRYCRSKLVSTLSALLSSMLSWRVSQAWNPRQIQLGLVILKLVTVSSFSPFTLISDLFVDATGVVCHQLGPPGTDLHAIGYRSFVETLN